MFYESKSDDIYMFNAFDEHSHLQCPLHLHYHVEVVYMWEGSSVAVVDGHEYPLNKDSLLVVFPNKPHTYISTSREIYTISIISPNIMPEIVQLFDSYEPHSPVLENVSEYPELFQTIKLLSALPTANKESKRINVIKRGYMAALLGQIFLCLPVTKTNVEISGSMRTVMDYCARNYNKELSLSKLSEELHLSKYYISHLFGKEFKVSFNDYINSLRVSAACRLLCDTTKSVTEISEEVGFATARTFNRAFSKRYKLSPSEYRQASRRQTE